MSVLRKILVGAAWFLAWFLAGIIVSRPFWAFVLGKIHPVH